MSLLTEDWDGRKFAAWLFCFISWGVLVPTLLYYLHIYIQVRNKQLIKKRYSKIVIFCNLITVVFLAVSRPLSVLYACDILTSQWIGNLEHLLFTICIHIMNYCYLLRYWLLYYDIKWTIYSQKKTWYQYINADCDSYNNFWIKYHKTFKSRYMKTVIIIPIVIASSSTTYCFYAYHNNEKIYEFAESILAPIPIICELILFFSTPTFHDQIKLRHELRLFLIFACCAFAIWLTFPLALGIYNTDEMPESTYYWIGYCYIFMSSMFCFILSLIGTYWVLNRSGVIDRKHTDAFRILSRKKRIQYQKMIAAAGKTKKENNDYVSIIDTTKSVQSSTPLTAPLISGGCRDITGTPINDPNTLALWELLSTEYGFDAFIHHISQEFCVETLLSCVELVQFQRLYGVDEQDILLVFPECIPRSSIVYNKNYSCYDVIRKLCEKYIFNGSELELNISYRLRKDLRELYLKIHQIPITICKTFFNEVIVDMIDLMQDSFHRFKKTEQYQYLKINKQFNKKLKKNKRQFNISNKNNTEIQIHQSLNFVI